MFAVSPIPTPRGLIYFLAPEKGEEISWGGEEPREDTACSLLTAARHRAFSGWYYPSPKPSI